MPYNSKICGFTKRSNIKCKECARLKGRLIKCISDRKGCEGHFQPTCERRYTCMSCLTHNKRYDELITHVVVNKNTARYKTPVKRA